MRLRLVVRVEGPGGTESWQREVDRPYAGVPRAQDWIFLGESSDGEGLAATPVAIVSWENDGTIVLRFDLAGSGPDADGYLELLGFVRASS